MHVKCTTHKLKLCFFDISIFVYLKGWYLSRTSHSSYGSLEHLLFSLGKGNTFNCSDSGVILLEVILTDHAFR